MSKVAAQFATPQMFTTSGIAVGALLVTYNATSERIQLAGLAVAGLVAIVHAITEAWIKIQSIRVSATSTQGADR